MSKNKDLYIPVGEKLDLDNGKSIVCVEDEFGSRCEDCIFHQEDHPYNMGIMCYELPCLDVDRKDHNNVHFEYIK